MTDTGLIYATSAANDTGVGILDWQNVSNALGNNTNPSVFSSCTGTGFTTSNYLKFGFTHGIASGKTIVGIKFAFYRYASDSDDLGGANDNVIKVTKNGSIVGNNKASQNWPSSSPGWSSDYGGASDTWGTSLTSDDTIGFVISTTLASAYDSAHIHAGRATVYYTDSGGGGAPIVVVASFFF